ncbi:MAG: hypothetical protein IT459_21505 [Planctomycetes bacterium]|nr:hypothetical protein [Planctomycetota bacterium]
MISPLLCLALWLPSEPDAVTTAELTTRVFDLAPILQPRASANVPIPLLPVVVNPYAPIPVEEREPTGLSADVVVDLVRTCVWPEEWEFEGRALERMDSDNGTVIRVTLPAARMHDVEQFLRYLTETLTAETTVTVSVHRVIAGPKPPRAIPADASGVAELQRNGQLGPARSFRMRLQPGRVEQTALRQTHSYVADYDVEIAQAAARAQPILRQFETGTELAVRGDVMRDGRVALQFAVTDSVAPLAFEAIDVRGEAQFVSERGAETSSVRCMLQSPLVRCATVAGTAELAAGEVVVVGAIDPSALSTEHAGIVVVVRADSIAPKARVFPLGDIELRTIDVGYVAMAHLDLPVLVGNRLGWSSDNDESIQAPPHIDIPNGIDSSVVESATFASGAFDSGDVYVTSSGPFVFLRTRTTATEPRERGSELEGRLLARLPDVPSSAVVDLRMGEGDDMTTWGRVSTSIRGGLALAGSQESYVESWEVDVANNSSIVQPNTYMLPSVVVARASTSPTGENSRSIRVQFVSRLRDGAKVVLDPQMPMLGISHAVNFLKTEFDATRALGVKDALPFGLVELAAGRPLPMIVRLN